MIKSKLIEVLKTLDKGEIKELGEFIDSPYYNKNKNVRKLFRELVSFYPTFESKKLSKEFLYSKVIPGKTYSDKTFRNLSSDLNKLVEKYLAVSLFHKNELYEKYLTISALLKKSQYNLTESNMKEADNLFSASMFDGGNIFYIMHLIEMEKDFLSISKNKLINLNMKEGEYLILSFFSKYLIFKMKFYNYSYKLGTEKLSEFIDEFEKSINIENFVKYLESRHETFIEIILIYYYCTRFMKDLSADSYYQKIKPLLKKNKGSIVRTEIINIYLTINAFCVAKIRSGDSSYEKELFGIYKTMLDEKLVVGENEMYLHITLFNNIVTLALKLGETEWTKSFIDKYSGELLPELRDTMYHYSYSNYFFRKKEYEKAMEHINKVNFENYYIKSGVRVLLLKLYYELKYTESFYSLCDTIKHYLANDKLIPEDKKNSDYELVILSNKLYKYSLEPGKSNLKDLVKEISNSSAGGHKRWLLEKINELKSRT